MANEVVREVNPIVSPDSIRASLNFLNAFNETHTKRFCSREDANGCKYIGTTENFGDEILIESRKLKMDKPSLKKVFNVNTFDDYFDIDFSHLIESYHQQNMLVALLKKDVLIHGSEYILKFENCTKQEIIRAEYNDTDPHHTVTDLFYVTETPPSLIIDSGEPIPLEITFADDTVNTKYMFHYDLSTQDMVEEINEDNDEYEVLINVTNAFEGLPFVWITNNLLFENELDLTVELTQSIQIPNHTMSVENTGAYLGGYQILNSMVEGFVLGNDGQDHTHLYLKSHSYEDCDVYSEYHRSDTHERIKLDVYVHASNDDYDRSNMYHNDTATIDKIYLLLTYTDNTFAENAADYIGRRIITYDTTKAKIKINKNEAWGERNWYEQIEEFPSVPLEDVMDGGWYRYNTYARHAGEGNEIFDLFIVTFKKSQPNPLFNDRKNAVSGIHIDAGTDYTTHGVIKDQGLVYNLDRFDGIPDYLKSLYDRKLHRSHVEVYAIRDREYHNTITEKQTAALILDSGTPITELRQVDSSYPIVIYYDEETKRFKSHYDRVIDPDNSVSEINYVSGNLFSNMNIPIRSSYPKFVYHGNNYFSLGLSAFDRDKEIARVYAITNDSIKYENNAIANRPARTLARICDIPTDFTQLIHIKNTAPTIVFDMNYVRTEVSNNDYVLDLLYNKRTLYSAFEMVESGGLNRPHTDKFIMPYNEVGPRVWFRRYDLEKKYAVWNNFGKKADLTFATIIMEDSGADFAVNDTFYFMIGGRAYDCTVTAVSGTGAITGFTIDFDDTNKYVDPNNLDDKEVVIDCVKRSTESTSDISISITFGSSYWDDLFIKKTNVVRKWTHTYQYDETGNIWIWSYDDDTESWIQEVQVTGVPIIYNMYDINNRKVRSFDDSMLYNMTKCQNIIDSAYIIDQYQNRNIYQFNMPYEQGFDPTIDIIHDLDAYNVQGGIYTILEDTEDLNNGIVCQFTIDPTYTRGSHEYEVNAYVIPRYHELNLSKYHNYSNKLMIINNNSIQPELCLFFPSRNYHRWNSKVGYITDNQYNITYDGGDITYADMLYADEDLNVDWIKPDKTAASMIYHYNEYKVPSSFLNEETRLKVSNRQYLINFCVDRFHMDLEYANTLTRDQLYTYAITHMHMQNGLVYKRDGINKDHAINDKVLSNPVNSKPKGVGLQPSGDFLNITKNDMDINVDIDYTDGFAPPLYIFEMDDPEDRMSGIHSDYRIYDEMDNDITELSMIIKTVEVEEDVFAKYKYIFRNNKWIKLIK